ncbi:MAG: serine dehydratase subunit alpha family protein [Tissierellia bacterium]|nr:serine dehydratase subunit alpha family protein [Tissierellia bacterium]
MNYIEFLKEELVPSFGCTEPIAIALAAAKAKDILGKNPDKIITNLSGNMIKNAHSVKVPGTDGRKGIEISVVAGALLGDAKKDLEVLSNVDKSQLEYCDELIENGIVEVNLVPDLTGLYIDIEMFSGEESSKVVIRDAHTNVILIEKNGEVIFKKDVEDEEGRHIDLSFDKIYDFAKNEDYTEVKDILDTQIEYNLKIAKEGLENNWGSNIGSVILGMNSQDYFDKLAAYAAAGSDARMSGCELPVVINSGSGNQGITTAVPVIVYAKDNNFSDEELYRALVFANLISLYIKERIGKLSAYCGVVSAASGAIAGVGFLNGDSKEVLEGTISNALATNSGMICDGAKPSCASKIASSVRNAAVSYKQALASQNFEAGDGIVKSNLDETIITVGNIAKCGMKTTDEVVLEEMLRKE